MLSVSNIFPKRVFLAKIDTAKPMMDMNVSERKPICAILLPRNGYKNNIKNTGIKGSKIKTINNVFKPVLFFPSVITHLIN